MKEKYLHYLWRYKLIPFHKLQLSNGQSFKVLNSGEYNSYESGPDFLNAKIEIDSIIWSGNIELHVKSKDWILHNHHLDVAYNTVVLHVVYEHNGDIIQNNHLIPTLELKSIIDFDHFRKFDKLLKSKRTILCGSLLSKVPEIIWEEMKEKALFQRLNRKTENFIQVVGSNNPRQILYFLMARAMGAKINQLPFEELTHRLPLSLLKQVSKKNQSLLIQLTSGMMKIDSFTSLLKSSELINLHVKVARGVVDQSSWKFGGTRPGNAPTIRIKQFADICQKFDFEISFVLLSLLELKKYLFSLLATSLQSTEKDENIIPLTDTFKEQLIINCFVPFIFWYGQYQENELIVEKSLDLLRLFKPEENSIIFKWKEFQKIANNASDSQALLEIFNEYCAKKKCLSCSIGYCLLNK
jgi:hypothetical protein